MCAGIQRDGSVVAASINRAKPSGEELEKIFRGHIAGSALMLTDGLRSYRVLEMLADCTVVDVNHEEHHGFFNLNTVNSLHSLSKRHIIIIVMLPRNISTVIMLYSRLHSDVQVI